MSTPGSPSGELPPTEAEGGLGVKDPHEHHVAGAATLVGAAVILPIKGVR